jgi:hypothetical protein
MAAKDNQSSKAESLNEIKGRLKEIFGDEIFSIIDDTELEQISAGGIRSYRHVAMN